MKYFTQLLGKIGGEYWIALVLLVIHVCTISLPGREVSLASSNMMTNVIRLEALPRSPQNALVLAGSSITGRLYPAYFSPKGPPVVNVGLDGCGVGDALQSILDAKVKPSVLLLEINTTVVRDEKVFKTVTDSVSHWKIKAGPALPFLQAKERPVDLAYNWLHSKKREGTTTTNQPLAWRDEISSPAPMPLPKDGDGKIAKFITETTDRLAQLKQQGVRIGFVLIPTSFLNNDRHDNVMAISQQLAKNLSLPMFDLRRAGGVEKLSWTDGVHLTSSAAKEVVRFLESDVLPRIN